jgi:hypothetical protein
LLMFFVILRKRVFILSGWSKEYVYLTVLVLLSFFQSTLNVTAMGFSLLAEANL